MTQTKRCPIFKFGSWWCFPRQTPQESDCEINASFAQGCGCVINASRRCGVPATGCCGTGPCLDQSSDGITEHQGQAGLSLRRLAVAKLEVVSGCRGNWPLHCGNSSLQQATLFAHFFPERRVVWTSPKRPDRTCDQCHGHVARSSPIRVWTKAPGQAL